jgi:asparagine synthase (glutamine-hydrolysing)
MCGILAIISKYNITHEMKQTMLRMSRKLRHRGPDSNGMYELPNAMFLHERLSIVDPFGGSQPIVDELNGYVLLVNGEIYNHQKIRDSELSKQENIRYNFKTKSDCEAINALYHNILKRDDKRFLSNLDIGEIFSNLDGQFSFVLHDYVNKTTLVGRDPFGITPLYYGVDAEGNIYFASELKALEPCIKVYTFEPGHYMYFPTEGFSQTVTHPYFKHIKDGYWAKNPYQRVTTDSTVFSLVKNTFEEAVIKRLMADVPFGVLLSGGLDSSLVASIVQKYMKGNPDFNPYVKNLNSFSIGLHDSPDLIAAQKVADFLGTKHHNFTFTIEEGLNALRDVIYHLETYDITTIRASTPMYLLSRKIKSLGIKMVLSGEGSDELLGGYLYFHNAPDDEEHQNECKRKLLDLGYFDCLRANKSTMAWGLEARVPFLDTKMVKQCIDLPYELKGCKNASVTNPESSKINPTNIEKYVIRKAFDIRDDNGKPVYLPDEILWRQKEQFSDGVGYGWIDSLKEYTSNLVTNNHMKDYEIRHLIYPFNTPDTKEAFYYRMIFEELFPNRENTVKAWMPLTRWRGVGSDPSGRAQSTHVNAT